MLGPTPVPTTFQHTSWEMRHYLRTEWNGDGARLLSEAENMQPKDAQMVMAKGHPFRGVRLAIAKKMAHVHH